MPRPARQRSQSPPESPASPNTTVAKRRRLDNSLFDSLTDDVPLDDVVGGTVRMLEYDPSDGLLELLNLVVKSAGCATPVQLTAPAAAAHDLEKATEGYAPARYPLAGRDYARRFGDFFAQIVPELAAGEILAAQDRLVAYLVAFSALNLRSVRHAAAVALLAFSAALPAVLDDLHAAQTRRRHAADLPAQIAAIERMRDAARPAALARLKDVFPPIREAAAPAVALLEPARVPALLNDDVAAVRHAALLALESAPPRDFKRVLQIAERDVDARCRRQALRLLQTAPAATAEPACRLVFDADAGVRAAAAALAVHLAPEAESQLAKYHFDPSWRLLIALDRLEPTAEAAEALARAGRLRFAATTQFALQDFGRVKAAAADKAWLQTMAAPPSVLRMALAAGRVEWEDVQRRRDRLEHAGDFVLSVLEAVPRLLSKYEHDEALLADAVRLLKLADLGTVTQRGLETAYEAAFVQTLASLGRQPTAAVAVAVQTVLETALADDSPVAAAGRAEAHRFYAEQRARTPANLLAIAALAPHVDISDMTEEEWDADVPGAVALAAALGAFYPSAAPRAAAALTAASAAEELLQVYTMAAVNDVALPALPDLSWADVSERTRAAAQAARVLV